MPTEPTSLYCSKAVAKADEALCASTGSYNAEQRDECIHHEPALCQPVCRQRSGCACGCQSCNDLDATAEWRCAADACGRPACHWLQRVRLPGRPTILSMPMCSGCQRMQSCTCWHHTRSTCSWLTFLHMQTQGTNAHAILSVQPHSEEVVEPAAQAPTCAWQRKRMWFCPPSLVLLQRSLATTGGTVQMQTRLSRATLTLYHDHKVSCLECIFDLRCCVHAPSERQVHSARMNASSSVPRRAASKCCDQGCTRSQTRCKCRRCRCKGARCCPGQP